jgi:phage major head subunit gpT-like protein
MDEGEGVHFADLTQGYDETFEADEFGLGFRVSRNAYDDDLYHVFDKAAQHLGRSIRLAIETAGANVFNNGWQTGAAYLGADGVELFSRVHPFVSGGTAVNEITAAADLSATSLQSALIDIETLKGADGVPLALIAKTLLVPGQLRWDASTILESQKKAGTANNDKNVFLDLDLSYQVNHYLTGDDDAFITCDQNELRGYMRKKPKFENDDDFDTGDAKFKVTSRFKFGWADAPGLYGILGA